MQIYYNPARSVFALGADKGIKNMIWFFFLIFEKGGGGGCGPYRIWFSLIKLTGRTIHIYSFFSGRASSTESKHYIRDMKYHHIMISDKYTKAVLLVYRNLCHYSSLQLTFVIFWRRYGSDLYFLALYLCNVINVLPVIINYGE